MTILSKLAAQLPAWKVSEEFLSNLDASKLLIVTCPTGSGTTTIFPVLAAAGLPKEAGRVCCTQNRTQGIWDSTCDMWGIPDTDKQSGFRHRENRKMGRNSNSGAIHDRGNGGSRSDLHYY